jgi:hypothetical protein
MSSSNLNLNCSLLAVCVLPNKNHSKRIGGFLLLPLKTQRTIHLQEFSGLEEDHLNLLGLSYSKYTYLFYFPMMVTIENRKWLWAIFKKV